MDVFQLRDKIICEDYARYTSSFIDIADARIRAEVDEKFAAGLLWPQPLLQLNPAFAPGAGIDELVGQRVLHPLCAEIFRLRKSEANPRGLPLQLHRHQAQAIAAAQKGENYVLTTGTGSGKSLAYIVPIVDAILKSGTGKGIQAIIVYPMNALANSQALELEKFLWRGEFPVSFRRYTGQEPEAARKEIIARPPDILLTNYVMLELVLTRPFERGLVRAAGNLRFLVLDELHTYRGRQGADVAMLIRRLRHTLKDDGASFQCVGTSATLAGPGSFAEKSAEVAAIAAKLFGSPVRPENVIAETLEAATSGAMPEKDVLRACLLSDAPAPGDYAAFAANPLAIWIERTVGMEMRDGRLERCRPRPLRGKNGLAAELAAQTGVEESICAGKIRETLLAGAGIRIPGGDKPVFAFKLHQFISKGDTVYATIEPESARHITLFGQKFAPREDAAPLYPLRFCRDCGKEYYAVSIVADKESGTARFFPYNPAEAQPEGSAGYLFVAANDPWPEDFASQIDRLPEDWLVEKNGQLTLKRERRKSLPQAWHVRPDGEAAPTPLPGSTPAWFLRAPFDFCPACGVAHEPRVGEFSKLATLGSEGRSTATTVLSMSAVRHLRQEAELDATARKFLCFSDNRQDASLQAGHFNDFVEIGLIRSALYNALAQAGPAGLESGELPQKVFEALGLGYADGKFPREKFALSPGAQFSLEKLTDKTFRSVLAYRIFSDLERGWRIVAPNLEQSGLLEIEYLSLAEICAADALWQKNARLLAASPAKRGEIAAALLDLLRRRLAISSEWLNREKLEQLAAQSRDLLTDPWAIADKEPLKSATMASLRAPHAKGAPKGTLLTPRSNFGIWLRSRRALGAMSQAETAGVIAALVEILSAAGILAETPGRKGDDPGYQLRAAAMRWRAGDGARARQDTLRLRRAPGASGRTNPFFVDFYRNAVKSGYSMTSREHTAQVASEAREKREEEFRSAALPVLYCSPTLELGVDIKDLNVVGMRNVPPTPANYAQRSGRAGRGGQPALILTYCALGNSHDQHFFRVPEEMVAGQVAPPRIDLANEDLLRAHVHALWLGASSFSLGSSLADLMDINGQNPSLELYASVKANLSDPGPRKIALARAGNMLDAMREELAGCAWYHANWLSDVINNIECGFMAACERWRDLYRAARLEQERQNAIRIDMSRSEAERKLADNLRKDAEAQLASLTSRSASVQADFYSYRYFASEGFLPGYNFPRLPLYAFIGGKSEGEHISRPRFLAISEFGPNSFIYHEGAKYVIKGVRPEAQAADSLAMASVKICDKCGWLESDTGKDLCAMCGQRLPPKQANLFRMRNVRTRPRARISSDEEERLKYGYQLTSAYRFEERGGEAARRDATLVAGARPLAALRYGQGATLWRLNLGWANRPQASADGFLLDRSRGDWVRAQNSANDAERDLAEVEAGAGIERVIPYVEDRKNCLVFEPGQPLDTPRMLSLEYALKQAIQQLYQLEDSELAVEVMPTRGEPRMLLFVEAAEGGAGVLRRLVEEAGAIQAVARKALEICHFDPDGKDQGKAPHAQERCVAACYDCLMSYANQRVHRDLDRHLIRDFLLALASCEVSLNPEGPDRAARLADLQKRCDSELERQWLALLAQHGLRLPDAAQRRLRLRDAAQWGVPDTTVADFWYEQPATAIYIDGPWHDFPDRRQRDAAQQECLEDKGIAVIRFAADADWLAGIGEHPEVFGAPAKGGQA